MQKSELRLGVIISYMNLGISMLIPFVYTPIMLRILGQAEYGLFSLASSTVSYLSLLSFGFGSTIIRYISKYRVENNKKLEEVVYGFFLILYCILAGVVILCGIIIANNIEPIFQRGLLDSELKKMKILVMIMTFNSALSFPNSVFSAMITAHEKYFFRKLVDLLATVLAPLANLIVLYLGFSSVGMAVAAMTIQCSMMPLNMLYCSRNLKLKPRIAVLPKSLIKEMLGFSLFVFLATIVDMLFWTTDKVILGMLSGSVAVAIYNVGSTFNGVLINLSTCISGILVPKITGMVIKNSSKEQLSELFIRVGRLQFIIIALVISGFIVFGQSFIYLWGGDDYEQAYWIAILTMLPLFVPLIQNTGLTIITAQNKHQFRSIVYMLIAIMNAVSTYLVVPYWGVLGAAFCSCIAYIIGQGLIMNLYYYKVSGLDIPQFWNNIFKMSVVPIVMTGIGIIVNNYYLVENWCFFFGGVGVFSCIYIASMYAFSFNEYERNIFGTLVLKLRAMLQR